MSWDQKGRSGKRYFYLTVRVPGKLHATKRYLGCGVAAQQADQKIRNTRLRREARRNVEREIAESVKRVDHGMQEVHAFTRALYSVFMTLTGHRKHHGEWRKTKKPLTDARSGDMKSDADIDNFKPNLGNARWAVNSIVRRMQAGDSSGAKYLERWLKKFPRILKEKGTLASRVEERWIKTVALGDPVEIISLRQELKKLRTTLEGPRPSPFEKIMIEEILVAYLAVRQADIGLAKFGASTPESEPWLRRSESCQRRLRLAMEHLERARRLEVEHRDHLKSIDLFARSARPRAQELPGRRGRSNRQSTRKRLN